MFKIFFVSLSVLCLFMPIPMSMAQDGCEHCERDCGDDCGDAPTRPERPDAPVNNCNSPTPLPRYPTDEQIAAFNAAKEQYNICIYNHTMEKLYYERVTIPEYNEAVENYNRAKDAFDNCKLDIERCNREMEECFATCA